MLNSKVCVIEKSVEDLFYFKKLKKIRQLVMDKKTNLCHFTRFFYFKKSGIVISDK